jgi:PIN domain nuclease of toxin-antitoxin system
MARCSAVNFSETLAKMNDRGIDVASCKALLDDLGLVVTPFDEQQAILAASLRLRTRYDDVSLADRICLALALQRNLPLLTADTKWSTLGLAIEIRQIR